MGRKKKPKLFFKFGVNNYFNILKASFLNPNFYVVEVIKEKKVSSATYFFMLNIFIGFSTNLILRVVLSQDPVIFFFSISENLVFIPFLTAGLLALAGLFFVIAKLLGGKGSFKLSLLGIAYSTPPVIFFWIPLVNFLAGLYFFYLISLIYKRIHQLSGLKSAVLVVIPSLALVLLGVMLGIFQALLSIIVSILP